MTLWNIAGFWNPGAFFDLMLFYLLAAFIEQGGEKQSTHLCRSFAARLANTVLPRSVTSFKIRALTGSLSVIPFFASFGVFRVSTATCEAVHGLIYNLVSDLNENRTREITEKSLLKSSGMQKPNDSPMMFVAASQPHSIKIS